MDRTIEYTLHSYHSCSSYGYYAVAKPLIIVKRLRNLINCRQCVFK